jgi:YidC/Oxa1 family membrane protein insertase
MVLIWDKWQIHNGQPPFFFGSSQTTPAAAKAPAAAAGALPQATGASSASAPAGGESAAPVQTFEVTTDVYRLVFSSEGGSLVGAQLLDHAAITGVDKGEKVDPLTLLQQAGDKTYVVQTGLIGGVFPNHKTAMRWTGTVKALADGQDSLEVAFASEAVNGLQLVKTYTLGRGRYDIAVKHEVRNVGEQAQSPELYVQLVRDSSSVTNETPFYSTFTGPAIYSGAEKYQKVEFEEIDKNKATFVQQSNDGYVAMVQHYFITAWTLADGVARSNYVEKVPNSTNLYRVGMKIPMGSIAPGEAKAIDTPLFVGPQAEKLLEVMAPGLELVKDYGWLTILAKPLYWLLDALYKVLQNWGWAIVALVLLLKIAFYWLNAKAYSSMAKMKAINPRIMEMRERLKSNPQQMQQEMMKIYREEKVNPMGGCFPIMVQIPVFIALYWVLLSSVEMRNAPWVLWIHDLSAPDPYFILPLVMTLTTLLQTALNPAPPDPMQAKLMWFMPLIFSVMFFFFPAGLVLYWITNNILSIAQQWMINTRMGVPPQFNLPKFK